MSRLNWLSLKVALDFSCEVRTQPRVAGLSVGARGGLAVQPAGVNGRHTDGLEGGGGGGLAPGKDSGISPSVKGAHPGVP